MDDALAVAEKRCFFVITLWNYKVCDSDGRFQNFKTRSISIRFFKENLDFEFRSEFLPFVEHYKYREYWVTELRKRTDAYLQMERTDKPS